MKRFIVNRHGRIVFPFNFLPDLDFSVFDTLEQFELVVTRDFDKKAPSEAEIKARLESDAYRSRYELLQDLALYLRNINRYALTMYEKRPTRWEDVPRRRDDVFMPTLQLSTDVERVAAALESAYHKAASGKDRYVEDKVYEILLDVYRCGVGAAEASPLHRTVGEHVEDRDACAYQLIHYDPDFPGYTYNDIVDYAHLVPEVEALMRHAMVLHNQYGWSPHDVRLTPVEQLQPNDIVVVLHPKNDAVREFVRRTRRQTVNRPALSPPVEAKLPLTPVQPVVVKKQLAIMPRLEALAVCKGERICTNEDLIRNTAYSWSPMSAADILQKTGIEERRYTERSLEEISLDAARAALTKSGRRAEEISAVLFCSCTSARTMPAVSTWISAQLGMLQTHASCDILAACAGLSYGLSEGIRLMQESGRAVLIIGGEKFSDKVGTVRTSRMLFGDGAAALVIGPAPSGQAPDIEVFQTYASGPVCEVDAIVWPNPDFDNNLTVYGPDVKSLVKRYLHQMVDELRALPRPDGLPGCLLDVVDLVVPHQANKTMVTGLAREAGISADRLYFNIETMGNTSAASIPIALHDAIRGGVIDHPMRIFAPGFGAGATAGYVVMRVDPALAA